MSNPIDQSLLEVSTTLGVTYIHGFKADVTPVENLVLPDEIYDEGSQDYHTVNHLGDAEDLWISDIDVTFKNKGITSLVLPFFLEVINNSIVGEDGTNYIYDGLFKNNEISSIDLPSSLIEISESTFEDNLLEDLVIPKNVTTIGSYAFKNNNISQIILPKSLTHLHTGAFDNNPIDLVIVLGTISLSYYSSAFTGFNGDMLSLGPSTQSNFNDGSFGPDYKLYVQEPFYNSYENYFQNVHSIPEIPSDEDFNYSIDNIDDEEYIVIHGFSSGVNLTKVTFPREIEGIEKIIIDEEAFKNKGLTEVYLLDTVYEIRKSAFEDNLIEELNLVFALNLKNIGENAFRNNNISEPDLSNIKDLMSIGQNAFDLNPLTNSYIECGSLDSMGVVLGVVYGFKENTPAKKKRYLILPSEFFNNSTHTVEPLEQIKLSAFRNEKDIDLVYMPNTYIGLESTCFELCDIKNIVLSENLIKIGASCFKSNKLTEINLPESLERIGESCFDSNSMQNVDLYIPDNVVYIGNYAFRENDFNTVIIGDGLTEVPRQTFSKIKTLILGRGFKEILNENFNGRGLVSVIFSEGLEEIGYSAFSGNNLRYVKFPSTLKLIGKSAFANNSITVLDLPEGLEELGFSAFARNSIKHLKLPESLSSIGDHCFQENSIFKSIEVPSQIEKLGDYVFSRRYPLEYEEPKKIEVFLPEGLKEIGFSCFEGINASRVVYPSTLEKLEVNNFVFEVYMPGDDIHTSVYLIEELVLLSETPVSSIYQHTEFFKEQQWDLFLGDLKIRVPYQSVNAYKTHSNWESCAHRITHLQGPVHPSILDYQIINDKVHIHGFTEYIDFIDDLELPDKIEEYPVEVIGDNAFENYSFSSIILPRYLKSIGSYAFYSDSQNLNIHSLSFDPPSLSSTSFNEISNIYVDSNYIENYKEADGWGEYEDKIFSLDYTKIISLNEENVKIKGEIIEKQDTFRIDKNGNLFCTEILESQDTTKIVQNGKIHTIGEVIEKWQN